MAKRTTKRPRRKQGTVTIAPDAISDEALDRLVTAFARYWADLEFNRQLKEHDAAAKQAKAEAVPTKPDLRR